LFSLRRISHSASLRATGSEIEASASVASAGRRLRSSSTTLASTSLSDCEVDDVAAIAAGSTGLRTIGAACWRVAGTSAGAEALTGAGRFGRLPVATGAADFAAPDLVVVLFDAVVFDAVALESEVLESEVLESVVLAGVVLAGLVLAPSVLAALDLDACVLAVSALVSLVLAALALVSLCLAAVGFAVVLGKAFGVVLAAVDLGAVGLEEVLSAAGAAAGASEAAHASAVRVARPTTSARLVASAVDRNVPARAERITEALRGPESSGRSGHGFLFE